MPLPRLRIVADAHAWGAAHAFRHFPGFATELTVVEHAEITHDLLQGADVLVTRSSTRVDAALLAGTPVRFVGTATVGEDHVDKAWLAAQGIAFASAAGSSTGSVVEYWIAALLALHARGGSTCRTPASVSSASAASAGASPRWPQRSASPCCRTIRRARAPAMAVSHRWRHCWKAAIC